MHSYFGFVVRLFFELWPFNGLCHSLPQMYARGTMTRKYHQVSSRCRTNIPNEILTICGGKFTTRNRLAAHRRCGEVVVGADADRCDRWWRWFVGVFQHKSKHLFGLSRRFSFMASVYVYLFSVLLPNLKFCWPKGKASKHVWITLTHSSTNWTRADWEMYSLNKKGQKPGHSLLYSWQDLKGNTVKWLECGSCSVYNIQQIMNCIHTWFLAVEAGRGLDEISDCRSWATGESCNQSVADRGKGPEMQRGELSSCGLSSGTRGTREGMR